MNDSSIIPEAFWDRLEQIVPKGRYAQVVESFSAERGGSFRINTLIADRDRVLEELSGLGVEPKPLPWYPDGFTVPPAQRDLLGTCAAGREGRIWLQNPSSMVPPLVLAPEPGEKVLDLAAAPGSKTMQLACLMEGRGELAAVEVVKPRFHRLRRNLKNAGATFVRTYLQDGTRVWRYRPEYFDRVLVDAPCSTEGRFRSDDPKTFAYWSLPKIRAMARKQRALLASAVRCTRPGGLVVYSTCTFAPEENEAVIDYVLKEYGGLLEVEEATESTLETLDGLGSWRETEFDASVRQSRRVLPDEDYEAFYVCRLRKTGSSEAGNRRRGRPGRG